MKLFGSSGIRGLVDKEINPYLAHKVGQAIASQHEGGAIIVGRDSRLSGPMLEAALNAGIVSTGLIAGSLGVVPTPVVAWLSKEMQAEAGVAITASHNPPEYNGFKVFDGTGMALTNIQQESLEECIDGREFVKAGWSRIGKVEPIDGANIYSDTMAQSFEFTKEWNVVGDLFNGATCTVVPLLLKEMGLNSILMNAQLDGHFPSGNPEPDRETLKPLSRMVRQLNADIGFGFDGDGDRMMVVTEKGTVPVPDRVLAAYSKYIVQTNGGGTVVTHVGASKCVEDAVEQVGGKVIRTKVGDIYITEAMIEYNAIFGGEPVGAWVHPDVNMCPDGILSALRLLYALDSEGKKLSEFIVDIPEYPTLRAKIECPNKKKDIVLEGISERYSKKFVNVSNVNSIDGVRLELKDGWVLMRPSGTEPYMRITVEAEEIKKAEKLMDTAKIFVSNVLEELT